MLVKFGIMFLFAVFSMAEFGGAQVIQPRPQLRPFPTKSISRVKMMSLKSSPFASIEAYTNTLEIYRKGNQLYFALQKVAHHNSANDYCIYAIRNQLDVREDSLSTSLLKMEILCSGLQYDDVRFNGSLVEVEDNGLCVRAICGRPIVTVGNLRVLPRPSLGQNLSDLNDRLEDLTRTYPTQAYLRVKTEWTDL
ncbi:MAG: hypothetical protein HRU19_10120 [Pseudobacteriovorax sp.]|nr:hypothetical protein [Pseudobacteriovorax sp.]